MSQLWKNLIDSNIINKYIFRGLIRAFYDDEGSIATKGGEIRLFQDKKDILETFRALLFEFGIGPTQIKTYMKRNKKRFYFSIRRKSNLIKFQREIEFTSPKKEKYYK